MMKKHILLLALALLCSFENMMAQNSQASQNSQAAPNSAQAEQNPAELLVDKLLEQVQSFPQEKIYLHCDKPYYSAGDTIWFKAYMLHAALHQQMNLSRYIYVELINSANQVISREKLRPENDLFYCQLPISPNIVPGQYSLRAYTNYMRNIDEDYFFRKDIYIGNVIKSGDDAQEAVLNTPYYEEDTDSDADNEEDANASADYAVQFFPEGGHLIAGALQKIAFKAVDKDGWGCFVQGRIVDAHQQEITQFQSEHLGMGCFAMVAQKGQRYTAICENELGEEYRIDLTPAQDSTYSISLTQRPQQLIVQATAPNDSSLKEDLYLVAHMRGIPYFHYRFDAEHPHLVIPKKSLPAGVMQFILMNAQGECLAERLAFIRQTQTSELTLSSDQSSYGRRDRAHIHIQTKDAQGQALAANLSVSVTSNACIKLDSSEMNIESYLLLSSDLRGHIEQAGRYFLPENQQADAQLELLMMTQGWRRYDIPQLCQGKLTTLNEHELEVGSILCGKLQTYPIRRAIPNAHISIFNAQYNYVNAVNTDNRGRFCFDGFEYPDSTSFFVQAEKKQQGVIMELSMEAQDFPQVKIKLPYSRKDYLNDQNLQRFLHHSRERYYFENGSLNINLDEVAITAKKSENIRRERGALYSDASYTFEPQDIEDMMGATLLDVLVQAPGMTLNSTGDGVLLRNATPLVVINNMTASMQDLGTIQLSDVEMIDILKDPVQTAMYQGGGNGVICIYLKRGQRNEDKPLGSHQKVVPYLGYTTPKAFYQPIYSVEKNRNNHLPDYRSTLYWQPDLKSDENGQADFRFYMGDDKADCTILIEGIGANGEIIRQSAVIKGH